MMYGRPHTLIEKITCLETDRSREHEVKAGILMHRLIHHFSFLNTQDIMQLV